FSRTRGLVSSSIDIDESKNGAVDFVISCAIRADPQRVEAALSVTHLALAHAQRVDDFVDKLFQVPDFDIRVELGDSPPNVDVANVKCLVGGRSGAANGEGVVHHHDREMHAAQEVTEITVDLHDLEVPIAQFLVERG